MKRAGFGLRMLLWCLGSFATLPLAWAQSQTHDLSTASLEELTQMQVSVSSFARKNEDLWKTPAGVFVITKEDIAGSSVQSVPELLRMVPGMQVAQVNASTWAVSARGFNSAHADKLLVLIDGRTVYSEIYSGTNWDQIDLPLGSIERIEVIRGPGAAMWGTNAVNGVINIITKKARSTMGWSVSNQSSGIGQADDVRYGGAVGERMQYRGFASYINRRALDTSTGTKAFDGEYIARAGGRMDWQRNPADWISFSGDVGGGQQKQNLLDSVSIQNGSSSNQEELLWGGHVLARWEHKTKGYDSALQVYYDTQSRHEVYADVRTRTFDIDYQNHRELGNRHDIVCGGEFRFTADHLQAAVIPTTLPDYRNYLLDGFLQDEIAIIPQRLVVTIGSKVQNGTLAGFQVQPSVRVLWAPDAKQSLWGAVSRAAVAPSIQDKYFEQSFGGSQNGINLTLRGNPDFKPETVVAYELGYRRRIVRSLTLDVATFFNFNDRIQSISIMPATSSTQDLLYTNGYSAKTAGIEASASWKPLATLSLQGGYTWMQAHITQVLPGQVIAADSWNSPRNSFAGSASWKFASRWTVSGSLAYVAYLPSILGPGDPGGLGNGGSGGPETPGGDSALGTEGIIPGYSRLDFHVARKLGRSLEFDAGGTNLLTPRHIEYGNGPGFVTAAQVPRSLFIKTVWSF
jgi:iron complex outermembrane receptor protein